MNEKRKIESEAVEIEGEEEAVLVPSVPPEIADIEQLQHTEWLAKNIDRFIEARKKIWQGILKLAMPGDWVVFESKDLDGNVRSSVCLSGPGAERIAGLGVKFVNWKEAKKEIGEDDKGPWYRYWWECDAIFGGRILKAIGRASSRDKLFFMVRGEMRELSEIDEGNVKVAGYHNCMKEGVKLLFGLRNIPKEEFEKAGIELTYARRVKLEEKPKEKAEKPRCKNCGREITQDEVAASKKYCAGILLCGDCQGKYKQGLLKF